jgi:pilus assembly protein Flp/PilA
VWREFPLLTKRYRLVGTGHPRKEGTVVTRFVSKLRRFGRRDEGASAVEYGLLVALIAVVIAVAVTALGGVLNDSVKEACRSVANGSVPSDCQNN